MDNTYFFAICSARPSQENQSHTAMSFYPFDDIETKWQKYWQENKTFRTPQEIDTTKPKYYVLDMFPYPSGAGLHVGHPEGYTATDILARYKRMKGFNVLHPMGWDAFGLPAEQYALDTGTHPRDTTVENIDRFRGQLQRLGFSYDWDREVATIDPKYYRWTQWIFLQLYKKGLAYQAEVPVNWCAALGTVLANEEVIDGKSERGGHPVERLPMKQWMLKITAYADRLIEDLEDLDWPESIKEMQRNWIGRSEGAEIEFKIVDSDEVLKVYTTRPDTIFGATYMVVAPEHKLVDAIRKESQGEAIESYIKQAQNKSDLERTELQKDKTGVDIGARAINPANGEEIPIWIADYVLATYGTGAIMAVPGQDDRDWEFAETFDLEIRRTVQTPDGFEGKAYTGDGLAINSGFLDGMKIAEAKSAMITWLEENNHGYKKVNYRLRDWLFSRQRYWGEPFPIVHTEDGHFAVPEEDLPVALPDVESYKPSGTGESPLATIDTWINTTHKESGKPARRETNTMPQWAGSCWYYLRFIDPDNKDNLVDLEAEKYWMPVDLYVGGAEHAVLHLLYARFWHKVLFDLGVVSTKEPFQELFNQGMILGEVEYTGYIQEKGDWVSVEEVDREGMTSAQDEILRSVKLDPSKVTKKGDHFVLVEDESIVVNSRAHKMSKSRGNVVNPDEIVDRFGADSLRLYEMFMGPLDQVKPWSTKGVEGVFRFLNRVWRLFTDGEEGALSHKISDDEATKDQLRLLHKTIKKVSEDVEGYRFNTAISSMMEFVNEANSWESLPSSILKEFALLLSPFSPHLAEELHEKLGASETLAYASWPILDESYLVKDTIVLPLQINGKVRANIEVSPQISKEDVLSLAKENENIAKYLSEGELRKEIYVPGRIVNFVVS